MLKYKTPELKYSNLGAPKTNLICLLYIFALYTKASLSKSVLSMLFVTI